MCVSIRVCFFLLLGHLHLLSCLISVMIKYLLSCIYIMDSFLKLLALVFGKCVEKQNPHERSEYAR
jgi:hypothetical protein